MNRLKIPRLGRRQDADVDGEVAEPGVRSSTSGVAQWTGGSQLAARVVTYGLWAAVATGPAALYLTASQDGAAAPVTTVEAPQDHSNEQAAASELAEQLVVTWLEARDGQEEAVEAFGPIAGVRLPKEPASAYDVAVAGIEQAQSGEWSVTVGVTVARRSEPATRRYFRVPVEVDGAAVKALTLPMAVAAPTTGDKPQLEYADAIASSDPAYAAVGGFLTALLTDAGDVSRYTAPEVVIEPVTPAPYVAVKVDEVLTDIDLAELGDPPADGSTVRVLASAAANLADGDRVGIQYALTLTARAGRWEVSAIDAVPLSAAAAEQATTPAEPEPNQAEPNQAEPSQPEPTQSDQSPTASSAG